MTGYIHKNVHFDGSTNKVEKAVSFLVEAAEGKLTPWDWLSGSLMKDLFNLNIWDPDARNNLLKQIMNATNGIFPEPLNVTPQMLYGTEAEVAGMRTCLTLAGLPTGEQVFQWQFGTAFFHKDIKLACSLDGIYDLGDLNLSLRTDPDNNVHTPNDETIYLTGKGVIEHKTTGMNFDDKSVCPDFYEIQARCNLEVMASNDPDFTWYAVSIVYGNQPHIYFFERDPNFSSVLAEKVNDFYRRLKEEDYYPPETSKGCDILNPLVNEERTVNLSSEALEAAQSNQALKNAMKDMKKAIDLNEMIIKSELGDAKEGVAFYEDDKGNEILVKTTRQVRNYKATSEKYIPAKPARTVLSPTVYIKEVIND